MIGQKELINKLTELYNSDKFPRTMTIVGNKGSGKRTLCHELSQRCGFTLAYIGVKVDDIRNMITNAYTVSDTTVYIIPEADTMSGNAVNALLKVTEEPPNNAYFILLYNSVSNILNTIKSRSEMFYMNTYSAQELKEYTDSKYKYTEEQWNILKEVCETPGEIDILINDVVDFYAYSEKVFNHIATVSSANCFKIANKVALKDTEEGYDINLFWKMFMLLCLESIKKQENMIRNAHAISITSKYMQDLRLRSVNKQTLMDMWILDIRKAWM